MKVTITYFPKDEGLLATLLFTNVSRILDRAKNYEEEADGGQLRRIVFLTKPPSREGRKAVFKTKREIGEKRKKPKN